MTFVFLSDVFYNKYSDCAEIEQKNTRPYIQVCISIDGITYAVPLRSNIKHQYVLWTDKESRCGLDFSKTVVLSDSSYIDTSAKPYIRPVEFDALRGKEYLIKQRLLKYIRTYKKARENMGVPRNQRICQYSALQYFEEYI